MSGKTARRNRAKATKKPKVTVPKVTVYDAEKVYTDVVLELMSECGIDETTCTNAEIKATMRKCSDFYLETYDDYLISVLYDGDRMAAKNDLAFIRACGGMPPILMGT